MLFRSVGGWVDVSSGAAGTVLMLSVPVRPVGATDAGQPAFDQFDDHDPSAWGTP